MALSYLRNIEFTASSIVVLFNDDLDTNIGIGNVEITSGIDSVSDPVVRSVSVENEQLSITFSPLFPGIQYKIVFISTDSQPFQTIDKEVIVEDGHRNSFFVVSPGEDQDTIRNGMFSDISSIYDIDNPTLVKDVINSFADSFNKADDAIKTTKSGNYLSQTVIDEPKVRGSGPTDKLDNGGAFQILRVASTPTGYSKNGTLLFSSTRGQTFLSRSSVIVNSAVESLPSDPISLQEIDVITETVSDSIDQPNYFDGLFIRVSHKPVIRVVSVSLKRSGLYTEYDIERFGYTIKDNSHDTNSASININLETDEIELSSSSITGDSGGFLLPAAGDEILISYTYKRAGRNVDPDSVEISRVVDVVRESTPALITTFSLEHAPIVNSSGVTYSTDGVSFYNTIAIDGNPSFSVDHPAFTREIPYDVLRLPARAGEYSVNYTDGKVIVYGEDETNKGTGENSPAASYSYKQVFSNSIDYTFNSDSDSLSLNSTRSLDGLEATISFNFEDTFSENTDFRSLSHVEVLNERINNRLIDDFTINTNYSPITDVFRIFNETTGEIYELDRFNDTSVFFTGSHAPRKKSILRERSLFVRVPQETLLVADELTNSIGLRIFKIELSHTNITDSQGRFVGANFDSSILFSKTDIFAEEFFYEDQLFSSVSTNLDRLGSVSDYLVDYAGGTIYVCVASDQSTDLGDVTYQYCSVDTVYPHILYVDNIYRSQSSLQTNITNYSISSIQDETADISDLEQVGERFIDGTYTRTLLIGTYQSGEDGVTQNTNDVFTSNSAIFTADDIGRTLNVGSAGQAPVQSVEIIGVVNTHQVVVTPAFDYTKTGRVWNIVDLSAGAPKTITLDNNIVSVSNIYTVSQLGTLPFSELDGYYDIDRDDVSSNIITLGDDNPLQLGEAVIVNYNYGNVFIDYTYLQDELLVSYEYGRNSIDWSISSSLATDDEYYVTYKYGALRNSLLLNFGSLTQIPQLTNFSPNLNRETYRSVLGGTLQSFVEGPTVRSIERLVESFTDVTPEITESAFSGWILGRDKLHLRKPEYVSTQLFDTGKFGNGALLGSGDYIGVPAVSHIKLNEGTVAAWVRPGWGGTANDASLTFDIQFDGYYDETKVYIGFAGTNPESIPFTLNAITDSFVSGTPNALSDSTGYFIWFDEFTKKWNIVWRENSAISHEFSGSITTDGEIYSVSKPLGLDGYEINEISDVITSSLTYINFSGNIDGYDADRSIGFATDGISFSSDKYHYLFDMAESSDANRMSVFKDGSGYLNYQVFDNRVNDGLSAGFYNMSKYIGDWQEDELHHVAVSWKFNTTEEADEMHLFVDGQEVTNLFKYGGNPKADSSYYFGSIAEEIVEDNSSRPVFGTNTGSTTAGSTLFIDLSSNFVEEGINVGDTFYLLDATADGTEAPNLGAAYTISGVGEHSLTLDRAATLTLGDLNYSINSIIKTVDTHVNIQDFVVVTEDADGNETELRGIDSDLPDYSVARGLYNYHTLTINNGVALGDKVVIRPLGLMLRRCKERVYVYGGGFDEIRINAAPPVSLSDVSITSIILDRSEISEDGYFEFAPAIVDAQLVTVLQKVITDMCQPSNQSSGKKLDLTFNGDNFDYTLSGNYIVINGSTYSGATSETVSFTSSTTKTSVQYWTTIENVTVYAIPIDYSLPAGTVEIKESVPMTVSENSGDYVEVVDYSNGVFRLETYGSGGMPFILNACNYEIDYPSYLRIIFDGVPDKFYIGSDYSKQNGFNGTIDEVKILDFMANDTRIGETLDAGDYSITAEYSNTVESESDINTTLLMHFNNTISDSSDFRDRFDKGFEVSNSLNDLFGRAIKFGYNNPYVVYDASLFNTNEGSIEFWVNTFEDSMEDPNYHYYIDMSSSVELEIESVSKISVISTRSIREVESVRLVTDLYNTGVDYFSGGHVSTIDNKTITLGIPLPDYNTMVKVRFVSLDNQGDRVSIFRDSGGRINFFMKASGVEHLISVATDWSRNTWHRVMVMWKTNSTDNQDRLRLFVDGNESGTIRYGTGLIYGTGVVYGQEEVRSGADRFLVDNIDLTDIFTRVFVGADVLGNNGARAKMDNIRFSEIQRLETIKIVGSSTIDINYYANTALAVPVISDVYTTGIFDFNDDSENVVYLATITNKERGIFKFGVKVVDSFNKITGNEELQGLLATLINTIKASHTEAIIEFVR